MSASKGIEGLRSDVIELSCNTRLKQEDRAVGIAAAAGLDATTSKAGNKLSAEIIDQLHGMADLRLRSRIAQMVQGEFVVFRFLPAFAKCPY